LSAEGGGQQEFADEIDDFSGCVPKAGGSVALVGGARDADDGADVINPFGIGEGSVWVEHRSGRKRPRASIIFGRATPM